MGKKSKRKTRWRSLPIGDASSQNEEDVEETEEGNTNHEVHHNGHYRKYRPNNGYKYHHHGGQRYSSTQNSQQNGEKKQLFNEDEYTKITTPRQDVLFKKGYLGRRRPLPTLSTPETPLGDTTNGEHSTENGESQDNQSEASSETVTSQEQPPIIYTNGYMDPHGGPIFYLNGAYDMYEPYSGVYSSFMVPAGPGFHGGGPAGPGSVLTAVPCQPLPLQPLEWFNPRGHPDMGNGWCLVAPCPPTPVQHPHLPPMQRKKRYSTDSQNCSPHSSESTGPPGSPQHEEETELLPPDMYSQPPPAYVYPGYMFGPAVYNVNGVAVPGPTPVQTNGSIPDHVNGNLVNGSPVTNGTSADATAVSAAAQAKRRKKKRRRKRRRGFRGEGAGTDEGSEESSSEEGIDDKDAAEENSPGPACRSIDTTNAVMSASSPGSATASLPPATSESCSELSAASSSHNSHDETDPVVPVRPSRKHNHDANGTEAKESNEQENVQEIEASVISTEDDIVLTQVTDVESAQKEIKGTLVESSLDSNKTIIEHESPETYIKQELVLTVHEDEISPQNTATLLADPVVEVASIIESTQEIPNDDSNVRQETLRVSTSEEKLSHKNGKINRKGSRKSRHHAHTQQSKSSSEENVAESTCIAAVVDTVLVSSERITSSLSLREDDRASTASPASPVAPPRRRGKAKHRPPTPCNLPDDQDNLAYQLSEQIINEAIVEAIRQCSSIEETEVTVSSDKSAIQRPITEAVTNWLQTNPDPLINLNDVSDDEEDDKNDTGSKNGLVNPLPAPSNSFVNNSTDGPEKRVGKNASLIESSNTLNEKNKQKVMRHRSNSSSSIISSDCSGEWDTWDDPSSVNSNKPSIITQHQTPVRQIEDNEIETLPSSKYDPAVSVAKYYQLTHDPVIKLKPQEAWLSANEVISDSGIESGDEPQSPKINFNERSIKFVRHLQGGFPDTEPFPCGACCNIQ